MSKRYKYRINELLDNLPLKVYKKALRVIPKELHISEGTFKNYRAIRLGDFQDIPHEKVVTLEKMFNLQPNELQNFEVDARPLTTLIHDEEESSLVTKFNMKKH